MNMRVNVKITKVVMTLGVRLLYIRISVIPTFINVYSLELFLLSIPPLRREVWGRLAIPISDFF